ncbi:hypothetical protein ARMSODRAFT_962264 [Armillaria solidipes]|uniref:Uncharacterized protein n=1 Tax=Armillaria solidipes TaxID=1076256 RepID=A0A2H3BM58_9AGAR|nr:hypothetical protein ARMSODRAFT_962264 [Armillaria solidipes]
MEDSQPTKNPRRRELYKEKEESISSSTYTLPTHTMRRSDNPRRSASSGLGHLLQMLRSTQPTGSPISGERD